MGGESVRTIEFRVARGSGGVLEVTPSIDGRSLIELVGAFERDQGHDLAGQYAGLRPSQFRCGDLGRYYLGEEDARWPKVGVAWLLGCDCGEVGCWPLEAEIAPARETVTWSNFCQPHRAFWSYEGFGPFTFDRAQYEAAVVDAIARLGAAARSSPAE